MAERESETGADCGKAALYMAALILNETVNAANDYSGDTAVLTEAVQDTLGLAEAPAFYYEKYGAEALFAALDELGAKTGFCSYSYREKSAWDALFK